MRLTMCCRSPFISVADPSVLACAGMVPVNVTAEGCPGKRYHSGCAVIDGIERLAIDRARAVFRAQYANVQPHSASSANYIVMTTLLRPGDARSAMATSGIRLGTNMLA